MHKPERYSPGQYLPPLEPVFRGAKIFVKWPDEALPKKGSELKGERPGTISRILSRDSAMVQIREACFRMSRFAMRWKDRDEEKRIERLLKEKL